MSLRFVERPSDFQLFDMGEQLPSMPAAPAWAGLRFSGVGAAFQVGFAFLMPLIRLYCRLFLGFRLRWRDFLNLAGSPPPGRPTAR